MCVFKITLNWFEIKFLVIYSEKIVFPEGQVRIRGREIVKNMGHRVIITGENMYQIVPTETQFYRNSFYVSKML